jgi:hypothetical protein
MSIARMAGSAATALVAVVALSATAGASAAPPQSHAGARAATTAQAAAAATVGNFSFGEPQATTVGTAGCGTNNAGEPSLHVSRNNLVELGSENGLGGGSVIWTGGQVGGTSVSACALPYRGQPNGAGGVGPAGGDIDTAFGSALTAAGTYRLWVASLNLGSVDVATSVDNGKTFTNVPVVEGVPVDDREWIAAYGADTALLSYHDIATNNIDVLKSTDGGTTFVQTSTAIPPTDYKATNNELGNLVIDHRRATTAGFWAYQSFVAPSTSAGSTFNEAFLSVSNDGGATWAVKPIGCSTKWGGSLDHNFPNVSVAPDGSLWYAVSNDTSVFVAKSTSHGSTWTCSSRISTAAQAIFPWLAATSNGVDLVYYGRVGTGSTATWYVDFQQAVGTSPAVSGFGAPQRLMPVHTGAVCEGGISCTGGRQLLDDFAVDTDQRGWAHIAYSHDAPSLGGSGSFTGYAVQIAGTPVGHPN